MPLNELSTAFVLRFGDTAFYRPLVTSTHSFDFAMYKTFAPGYHLTNVLLHLGFAAAVPLFLSVFFNFSQKKMLLTMIIAGAHPLTWLPVGAISYRPELLVTLFILLTVYFHAKARVSNNELYRFLAVTSFFLALISKETAIILVPMLILFWEFLQKKRYFQAFSSQRQEIYWNWSLYISEGIAFVIYVLFRFRAVPEIWKATTIPLSFSDAIGTRLAALLQLYFDFISPFKPPLSDATPVVGAFTAYPIIALLILLLLLYSAVKAGIRSSWGKAVILWLIMLTPALNIVPVPRIGSPHYGFLPLAAFSALVILVFFSNSRKSLFIKRIGITILGCWLLIMSATTMLNGFQFKNDLTLFQPEVTTDPQFLEGHFYLGNYYLRQLKFNEAEKEYKRTLQSNPKVLAYSEEQSTYINLASIYLQKNQLDKAEDALSNAEALSQQRHVQALYHNRIILAYKKHDYKNVINLAQDDRSFPYTPIIYIVLSDSLHRFGQIDEAVAALQQVLPFVTKKEQQKIRAKIQTLKNTK